MRICRAGSPVRSVVAVTCMIALAGTEEHARLTVTDDGRGPDASGAAGGSGLRGLSERLGAAGGTLGTGPLPGGGFRVTAELPVTAVA